MLSPVAENVLTNRHSLPGPCLACFNWLIAFEAPLYISILHIETDAAVQWYGFLHALDIESVFLRMLPTFKFKKFQL